MTSQCWISALLYFGGIPLGATIFIRMIYGLMNQLAPPTIDEMPSFSRMFVGLAVFATVL